MARTKRTPTQAELDTIASVASAVVPYQNNRQVVVYTCNKSPAIFKPLRIKSKRVDGVVDHGSIKWESGTNEMSPTHWWSSHPLTYQNRYRVCLKRFFVWRTPKCLCVCM